MLLHCNDMPLIDIKHFPLKKGVCLLPRLVVVTFTSRTNETQSPCPAEVATWLLKSINLPWSEGQTGTSYLQRGTLVHPASLWLTQSSQTLLLLKDQNKTILRATGKTAFQRALQSANISPEDAAAGVRTVMHLTRHQGWAIAAHQDPEEKKLQVDIETRCRNKSAQPF